MILTFAVYGVPIPKGSTRAFVPKGWTRPIVTAANAKTRPWQEAVRAAAVCARGGGLPPEQGPVSVSVWFFVPKPKSAPRSVVHALKKPDGDKLHRTILDALTKAGIYHDDSQVVDWSGHKRFAAGQDDPEGPAGVPRAVVRVVTGANLATTP